jgi:hypothetical protein
MHMESREQSDVETLARTLRLLQRYLDEPAPTPAMPPQLPAERPVQRARGPRQEAILALPEMADAEGVKPATIAAAIDYSVSNTYNLLQSLSRAGLAEIVPGSQPQRWRLTTSHRHSASIFRSLAATVRPGEWTTCADLSIASRGDTSAAWMVCWAATKLPDFPSAHRVLLEGGVAHPYGHEHQRARPEQIRSALITEGVRFTAEGRADSASRVAWDQLRERGRR